MARNMAQAPLPRVNEVEECGGVVLTPGSDSHQKVDWFFVTRVWLRLPRVDLL